MNQYILRISLRSDHCLFYEDVVEAPPFLFFRLSFWSGESTSQILSKSWLLRRYVRCTRLVNWLSVHFSTENEQERRLKAGLTSKQSNKSTQIIVLFSFRDPFSCLPTIAALQLCMYVASSFFTEIKSEFFLPERKDGSTGYQQYASKKLELAKTSHRCAPRASRNRTKVSSFDDDYSSSRE